MEQGKVVTTTSVVTTEARCDGNGHATKEVAAIAKNILSKQNSLSQACMLETQLGDRRLDKSTLVWEQQPSVPQGLLLALLWCSSHSLLRQLLAAAATSCIQGDLKDRPNSAAMKIVPWRHEAIVDLHAIKLQYWIKRRIISSLLIHFIYPVLLIRSLLFLVINSQPGIFNSCIFCLHLILKEGGRIKGWNS